MKARFALKASFGLMSLVATAFISGAALPVAAQSQLGTGAMSGTVLDSSGATVAGAAIQVTSVGTGQVRSVTANERGQFSLPVLPPGIYTVRVQVQGFSTAEQSSVEVSVGGTAVVRFVLQPGAVGEVIEVNAAQVLDTGKTEESSLIDRNQINELPINGRRYDQFALLVPGVTRDGRFGLLSYRGQSGVFNNFTIEGNDDNQAYFGEGRGRTRIASSVSQNAVREFQVTQSNFLPEFGRSAGGGINTVIRSGQNDFHADGFYYFRNQDFGARDPLATRKPLEIRHQFGGSVSGRVIKDKLFYFVNYDQQSRNFPLATEDLSNVLTTGLPANASAADQAAFAAGTADLRSRFPGGAPGGVLPRFSNQNNLLSRVDWTINPANTFSVTYNYLNARGVNAIQTPLVLGNVGRNGSDDVRIHSLNARLTTIVSPKAVNEFRFQFGRDLEFQNGNQPPPQVFVGGFSYGLANFLPRPALPDEVKYQFVNNFSYTVGNHALKFGGEFIRTNDNINNPANFGGTYNYTNALTYGRDLVAIRNGQTARNYTSYTQSFGIPGLDFNTYDLAFFAQDRWRVSNRLTVNYGVRYDYQNLPEPIAPNPAVRETGVINSDKTNWGPRVGVAYDLTGKGTSVIRGGYGIYYGRTPNGSIFNALTQTGVLDLTRSVVDLSLQPNDPGAPVFPNVLTGIPANARTSTSLFTLDSDFKRPRLQEVNVGYEQKLFGDWTVSASFVYTYSDRGPISIDANLPAPAFQRTYELPDGRRFTVPFSAGVTRTAAGQTVNINASRPNPNFGSINRLVSQGESWYKGLFVEVKKRFAKGYQLNFAYTLSKAESLAGTGDGGGSASETPFAGGRPVDQFNLSGDRAAAPTDQRHRFTANGIYNLPALKGGNAFLRAALNTYRISGIFVAESGRPVTQLVQVPALPFSQNGIQYNGFGGLRGQGSPNVLPVIDRNSDYGDANFRFDMRVARDIRVTEKFVLELLVEGVNMFNRANYNGFNSTAFFIAPVTGTPDIATPLRLSPQVSTRDGRPTFGTPNNNSAPPDGTNARRFQVAARFRF